jgi:hypothetical protein
MIASRLKVEDPQDEGEGEKGLRAFDGAEDVRLGRTVGESSGSKADPGDTEQGQQEPDDGGENSGSAVELGDGIEKAFLVLMQGLDGDDRTEAASVPGRDRGAGDDDVPCKRPGAGSEHVLAEAMVINATGARCGGGDGHRQGRITRLIPASRIPE